MSDMPGPRITRTTRLLRTLCVVLPFAVVGVVASCGTQRDNTNADPGLGQGTPVPEFCSTPNEGCDCDEPTKVVDCGTVRHSSGDYVACSMGKRTCLAGRWGTCVGDYDVTVRRYAAGGGPAGLGTLALGNGAPCGTPEGGPANLCDPYCNAFVDNPVGLILDGGLVVSDGGITIGPGDSGFVDSGAPSAFASTADGLTTCGGATNIIAATCVVPGLTACQQDFRCEPASSTCVWNGGPGYYDPTAGGIDLTVGTPCGSNGSASSSVTVCNRGSAPALSGSPIVLQQTNAQPNGCTSFAAGATFNFLLSADLRPGECTNFMVGNSPGNKFITVNAGTQPGQPVVEGPGRCANNSAGWKTDGMPGCAACGACNTVVRGRVFDPSGASPTANANNVGLPNVRVFQPAGALTPLADNPLTGPPPCDTCASVASPELTADLSKFDGAFQLNNFTPGPNRTLVVQTGRWRRQFAIPDVTACTTTTLTAGVARLPRSRTDGLGSVADIPKTAIVLGERETLECMFRRIGIADTEFIQGTAANLAPRFHIYRSNGPTMTPGAPSGTALFQAGGRIGAYSAVIGDCDSGGIWQAATKTPAGTSDHDRIVAYADAGGKLFGDHWFVDALLTKGIAPWNGPTVASWDGNWATIQGLSKARVENGTPAQALLYNFLQANGTMATYLPPYVPVGQPRWQMNSVGSNATSWIRGLDNWTAPAPDEWTSSPTGNHTLSLTFETPLGAPPASQCGRFVANALHVSQTRQPVTVTNSTHRFPNFCTGYPSPGPALTAEELALEYQLFQLTACALVPPPPVVPPPPPPIVLPVVNYQRDYFAVCGSGERVKWGPFYWQAIVPPTSSIVFNAATASSPGALPSSPPAAPPVTAVVGTASATTTPITAQDCTGCPLSPTTVDSQLIAQTAGPSKEYLRVFMKFNPDVTQTLAPTLLSWRQIYDCVPAE